MLDIDDKVILIFDINKNNKFIYFDHVDLKPIFQTNMLLCFQKIIIIQLNKELFHCMKRFASKTSNGTLLTLILLTLLLTLNENKNSKK